MGKRPADKGVEEEEAGLGGGAAVSDEFWDQAAAFLSDKSNAWEEELGDNEEEACVPDAIFCIERNARSACVGSAASSTCCQLLSWNIRCSSAEPASWLASQRRLLGIHGREAGWRRSQGKK